MRIWTARCDSDADRFGGHDTRGRIPERLVSSGSSAMRDGNIRDRAQGRSAGFSGTARASTLSGGDQLQHFLRIVQPLLEFGAERLRCELRGDGNFSGRGIGGDELHFVDFDGRILVFAERLLELLGEILRLRSAHGKGGDQTGKVIERNLGGKMNAKPISRRTVLL